LPTTTFYNLPKEKRGRLLCAAWTEFTRVGFSSASINQVIKSAGISRGSFYQYFADKEDLFSYILDHLKGHVLEVTTGLLRKTNGDPFDAALAAFDFLNGELTGQTELSTQVGDMMEFFRRNTGINFGRLFHLKPDGIPPEIAELLDTSELKSDDPRWQLTLLGMLGGMISSYFIALLSEPERAAEQREALKTSLDIVRYGALKEQRAGNTPDDRQNQGKKEQN
jgi:AcrR family transcriptional regulator